MVTLQLGGGGDFLADLAKGFQAGFAPKQTAQEQDEASQRLRQQARTAEPAPTARAAAAGSNGVGGCGG